MIKKYSTSNMVQAITVLTVLKMLTNAQTTCNHGMGRVVYERIPDHQLQGFDDDVVRDSIPPFRMLEKCQDLCLRDRTAVNNLVRTCTSFNFQPGLRIASFTPTPEYEESICYLTREQAHPEGIGNLVLIPNSVHYTEVCLSSSRIERECPNRRYVFERHPRKKLKLLASDHKEIQTANRTDCEERCLNEFSFVCRSATYNMVERMCSMSRFTRRSHPELLHDDPNADYLENTCLSPERRCDGLAVFVKEENKKLGGPFEVDMYINITLEECQNLCLKAEKYFCRSIEYDDRRRECIISEEDSISQRDDLRTSSSSSRHLFDLVCLDNPRGEFSDNSLTSHLFADGRRPDTAFQRFRNSRLGGEFHSEITSRTLSECLDECLRQASFQCRSAVYSERLRVCRLSRFNQRDGHRIIYDAEFDYYENLMVYEGDGFGPNFRPDPLGQDTNYHSHGRPPFINGYSGYPGGSFSGFNGGGQFSGGAYSGSHYGGGSYYGGSYNGGGDFPSGPGSYGSGPGSSGRPGSYGGGGYPGGPGGSGYGGRPGDGNYDGGQGVSGYGGRPGDGSYIGGPGGSGYGGRPTDGGYIGGPGGSGYGGRPTDGGYIGGPGGSGYGGRPGDGGYTGGPSGGAYGGRPGDGGYPGGPGGSVYGGRPGDGGYTGGPSGSGYSGRPGDGGYGGGPGGSVYHGRPGEGVYGGGPSGGYSGRPGDGGYSSGPGGSGSHAGGSVGSYGAQGGYGISSSYGSSIRYGASGYGGNYGVYGGVYGSGGNHGGSFGSGSSHTGGYGSGGNYGSVYGGGGSHGSSYGTSGSQGGVYGGGGSQGSSYGSGGNYGGIYGSGGHYGGVYASGNSYYGGGGGSVYGSGGYGGSYPIGHAVRPSPGGGYPGIGGYSIGPIGNQIGNPSGPGSHPGGYPSGSDVGGAMYGGGTIKGGSSSTSTFSVAYGDRFGGGGAGGGSFGPGGPGGPGGFGGPGGPGGFGGTGGPGGLGPFGGPGGLGGAGGYPVSGFHDGSGSYPGIGFIGGGGGGGYPSSSGGFHGSGYGGFGGGSESFYGNKFSSRCDEGDNFRQVGVRLRIRRPFVKRLISAPSVSICERECADAREFVCRSFNYRSYNPQYSPPSPDNCELSDKDSRELEINSPSYFETSGEYDYFERSPGRQRAGDCLEVSQQCSEDGMEFALKTPEGFYGRIYTYGYYDRCFFRGNGGTINVLRISGAQGYPDCGTERYGDTMTNIVVVQFSDFVQTGRDKRYNLTCLFRGPGEAVVTSGYIGAGSGSPIPIEYLPAENSLSSRVRLMILYQNRPTTTIAVGDPLTFRLEAQDSHNYATDIFATNVIARDPYSGRSVQLIDRFGCPVDNYVFPGLDRSRDGEGLEARFNAFKIPESNFLVFEATVRTCRDGCQPAYCTGPAGRSEPSFGRRRRSVNSTEESDSESDMTNTNTTTQLLPVNSTLSEKPSTERKSLLLTKVKKDKGLPSTTIRVPIGEVVTLKQLKQNKSQSVKNLPKETKKKIKEEEQEDEGEEEFVREMIKVLDSRSDIASEAAEVIATKFQTVCMTNEEYYGFISAIVVVLCALLIFATLSGLIYRKYWAMGMKNEQVNATNGNQFTKVAMERRPFSLLMNATFKGRKPVFPLRENGAEYNSFSENTSVEHKLPYGIFGLRNRTDYDFRKGWNDSGFNFSKKLKEGTFGKNAGSISKRVLESLFSHDLKKGEIDIDNPLKCDENFIMTKADVRLEDPSEPIYTDPSLFDLERSRSLRSIAVSTGKGQGQKADGEH